MLISIKNLEIYDKNKKIVAVTKLKLKGICVISGVKNHIMTAFISIIRNGHKKYIIKGKFYCNNTRISLKKVLNMLNLFTLFRPRETVFSALYFVNRAMLNKLIKDFNLKPHRSTLVESLKLPELRRLELAIAVGSKASIIYAPHLNEFHDDVSKYYSVFMKYIDLEKQIVIADSSPYWLPRTDTQILFYGNSIFSEFENKTSHVYAEICFEERCIVEKGFYLDATSHCCDGEKQSKKESSSKLHKNEEHIVNIENESPIDASKRLNLIHILLFLGKHIVSLYNNFPFILIKLVLYPFRFLKQMTDNFDLGMAIQMGLLKYYDRRNSNKGRIFTYNNLALAVFLIVSTINTVMKHFDNGHILILYALYSLYSFSRNLPFVALIYDYVIPILINRRFVGAKIVCFTFESIKPYIDFPIFKLAFYETFLRDYNAMLIDHQLIFLITNFLFISQTYNFCFNDFKFICRYKAYNELNYYFHILVFILRNNWLYFLLCIISVGFKFVILYCSVGFFIISIVIVLDLRFILIFYFVISGIYTLSLRKATDFGMFLEVFGITEHDIIHMEWHRISIISIRLLLSGFVAYCVIVKNRAITVYGKDVLNRRRRRKALTITYAR